MTDKITLSREQVEKCLRDALIIRFHTDSHVEALRAALSNQSAPADKGHGGPVGVIVEFGFGLKEVSWTNGKMPDLGTKLYAERPAPVAVATDFKMIGTEPMPPMEYDEP